MGPDSDLLANFFGLLEIFVSESGSVRFFVLNQTVLPAKSPWLLAQAPQFTAVRDFGWRLRRRQSASIFSCQRPLPATAGSPWGDSAFYPRLMPASQVNQMGVNQVLSQCCHFAVRVTALGPPHLQRHGNGVDRIRSPCR